MHTRYRVEITTKAMKDMGNLWHSLSDDDPEDARGFVRGLEKQILSLEYSPERHPIIPISLHLLSKGYRQLVCGEYRIIFQIVDNCTYILRIIHQTLLLDAPVED